MRKGVMSEPFFKRFEIDVPVEEALSANISETLTCLEFSVE